MLRRALEQVLVVLVPVELQVCELGLQGPLDLRSRRLQLFHPLNPVLWPVGLPEGVLPLEDGVGQQRVQCRVASLRIAPDLQQKEGLSETKTQDT